MPTKHEKALLEVSAALEITRFQRDSHAKEIERLEAQLTAATRRAERAEERLHETTMRLSDLGMQIASIAARSTATEVLMDGKSILRLNNPVRVPDRFRGNPSAHQAT